MLVKVFKKKTTTESGFCLVFGVGWGWRCPQKKQKKKQKKTAHLVSWLCDSLASVPDLIFFLSVSSQ